MRRIELTGKKIGRLTVLSSTTLNKHKQLMWKCKCDCGQIVEVVGVSLRNGNTSSCGCYRAEKMREKKTTHGAYFNRSQRERLYNIYSDMKARCLNRNEKSYVRYGARGISICDEWIESYSAFKEWALSNGYSDDLTIDRIDNDGNYEPNNCRWATMKMQANNKSRGRLPNRDNDTGRFISDNHARTV